MHRLFLLFFFCVPLSAQPFWTPARKAETVVYAASIAADSWATQNAVARGGFTEYDPLARPFVHSVRGQALGSSLGFLAGIVPSYFLHRAGHERLSRAWLHVFTGVEAVNASRMLYLYH